MKISRCESCGIEFSGDFGPELLAEHQQRPCADEPLNGPDMENIEDPARICSCQWDFTKDRLIRPDPNCPVHKSGVAA